MQYACEGENYESSALKAEYALNLSLWDESK